jgi:hypothetical protein
MNREIYIALVSALPFGKRVNKFVYVLAECIKNHSEELACFVEKIKFQFKVTSEFNVIKFSPGDFRISFFYGHKIQLDFCPFGRFPSKLITC